MPHHDEAGPDPIKPGLFRPSLVERINTARADPGQLPAALGATIWEYSELAPAPVWLPTETMLRPAARPTTSWSILAVTGDPGANGNRFDLEIAHMRDTLSGIRWTECSSISARQLAHSLRQESPVVLHVSAHAADETLALHVDGRISWAPFATVADILVLLPAPKLLVLNVCSCKALADLLATWAKTTIYWAEPINDDIARAFSGPFYQALLAGETVSNAVAIACADTPQLLDNTPSIHGNLDLILTPRL